MRTITHTSCFIHVHTHSQHEIYLTCLLTSVDLIFAGKWAAIFVLFVLLIISVGLP